MNIVKIQHNWNGGTFLFSVPDGIQLSKDQKVTVLTKYGEKEGTCVEDSMVIDDKILAYLKPVANYSLPLKPVLGAWSYEPFENEAKESTGKFKVGDKVRVRADLKLNAIYGAASVTPSMATFAGRIVTIRRALTASYRLEEDRVGFSWTPEMLEPIADKPEAKGLEVVRLYCVKENKAGHALTEGKIYEFDATGRIKYDGGYCLLCDKHESYEAFKKACPLTAACLFPLVKRPAKVGEWIYCETARGGFTKQGQIYKTVSDHGTYDIYFLDTDRTWGCTNGLFHSDYLVIDGYNGEYHA